MDYLTKYYKNLSEQLEEKIFKLESLIENKRQFDSAISPFMISTRLPNAGVDPHTLHGSSRLVVGMAPMPIDQKSRLANSNLTKKVPK